MSKDSVNIVVDSLRYNSQIFEESKKYLVGVENCSDKLSGLLEHNILVAILLFCFLVFFIKALWHFAQLVFIYRWKSHSQRNSFFFSSVIACFFSGLILYYFGYDYAGTYKNGLTLLLRSILSSFEMFLSKSNLIGIAENCKNSHWYMLAFACVHTIAVVLSAIFAVACFGRRIMYWVKSKIWGYVLTNQTTYVFWGLNERSYMLARDLYKKRTSRERIIFVDFPDEKDESNKSQGFSGLIGLLSFKLKVIRQLKDINYILYRSFGRPSELSDKVNDLFDELDLMPLRRILRNSQNRKYFIFTDNESSNLRAAINLLKYDEFTDNTIIYCAVRKTRFTTQLVEHYKGKLVIVDDSRIAVTALKKREVEYSTPIDYVTIDKDNAAVTSVFTAMVIGFGTTGQDALRFLYEFSALPDENGNKQKVRIDVIDTRMDTLEGDFRQEVPAIDYIKVNDRPLEYDKMHNDIIRREVVLRKMDVGSDKFYELLSDLVDSLNYVVIATGDDDRNLSIASYILEFMVQNRKIDQDRFRVLVRLYNENNRIKYESAKDVFAKMCDDYNNHGLNNNNPKFFKTPFVFFGNPKSLYTKSIIVGNSLEEDAMIFQEEYRKAVNDDTTWEKRREEANDAYSFRALYRKEGQDKANSMHRYTKERLLGIYGNNKEVECYNEWEDVLTVTDTDNAEQKQWKHRLIQASICEHLRWNAAHLMMGYVPMPKDKAKHFASSADEQRKEHKCLIPWNKLELSDQGYDYSVVKTTIKLKNDRKY